MKNAVKFRYLSKIYDLLDLFLFPKTSGNPRYGLLTHFENDEHRILDVCFGTGASSLLIAQNNPKVSITGIDLSPEMILKGMKKVRAFHLENIYVEKMDAGAMSFEDESFDSVIISLGLHEIPPDSVGRIMNEIFRVLKIDGHLFIIEWERPTRNLWRKFIFGIIRLVEPSWFDRFLSMDWKAFLSMHNLDLKNVENFDYTKLITAEKTLNG